MRIRTQFTITVVLFGAVLAAVGASLLLTNLQMEVIQKQEDTAHQLELGARELSYLSNDYLLHGESQQRARWEAKYASFSELLTDFTPRSPELAALFKNIKANQERLKAIFTDVASTIETGTFAHTGGAADIARIRVSWSRMEIQNQGMAFDASRLARLLEKQMNKLRNRRFILLFALIGLFGAFLVINYTTVNRRILRAISNLQAGAKIIGSGNLDFAIEENKADEIGDLSRAFNRMTADLKAVTASKADLEREMNERKQAEEKLRRLSQFPEENPYPVLRSTLEGLILYSNAPARHWLATLGWKTGGALPLPVGKAIAEARGQDHPIQAEITNPAGRTFGFFAVQPPGEEYINLYGMDLSDRKRALEALERSNRELEEFAYVASHDLQEPLRAVVGFLQLIQSRYEDQIDAKGRNFIERSVKAAHRMQTLIRQLLTLSRVHTKGATFEETDLKQIVKDVLDNLQTIIQEKNADITCADLPNLSIDASQIQRLFQNLIMNALRYNESLKPMIDIGCQERDHAYHFYINDNGIGISPQFHQRIFVVFQRLHTDREYPGTGLGLALCKRIVERHGGTIWVESQPPNGSTFYFTLPKQREMS